MGLILLPRPLFKYFVWAHWDHEKNIPIRHSSTVIRLCHWPSNGYKLSQTRKDILSPQAAKYPINNGLNGWNCCKLFGWFDSQINNNSLFGTPPKKQWSQHGRLLRDLKLFTMGKMYSHGKPRVTVAPHFSLINGIQSRLRHCFPPIRLPFYLNYDQESQFGFVVAIWDERGFLWIFVTTKTLKHSLSLCSRTGLKMREFPTSINMWAMLQITWVR